MQAAIPFSTAATAATSPAAAVIIAVSIIDSLPPLGAIPGGTFPITGARLAQLNTAGAPGACRRAPEETHGALPRNPRPRKGARAAVQGVGATSIPPRPPIHWRHAGPVHTLAGSQP